MSRRLRLALIGSDYSCMERPNILIILSDQHHARILGCAGDSVVRTPNLDRLAAEGVRFDQTYCAAPLCVPSRMTFMTSRSCSNIEVWNNNCILPSDIPTFAHTLACAGYETVLCGRMHFEGPDQLHGFEKRIAGDFTRNIPGLSGVTLAGLPAGTGQTRSAVATAGAGRTSIQAYDEEVTAAACKFIASREPGDRPWCMVVGYYLPHSPFFCSQELFDEYYDRVPMPEVPQHELDNRHPAILKWLEIRGLLDPLSEQQVRNARAAYYGMVTQLDSNIGKVLDTLRTSPHADGTLRVYLSDHGEMAGEHGMWWKSNFYDGSARVPMIWSWPGRLPQGYVRSDLTSLLDVGPTLEAFAGYDGPHRTDGHSLLPLLQDINATDPGRPDAITAELVGARAPAAKMIRCGPWKLITYHGFPEPQLFNLESDPAEIYDRAADPACAEIRRDLLERVCQGWDPEAIEQRLESGKADHAILSQWAATTAPSQPYVWQAPEGVNQFPLRGANR